MSQKEIYFQASGLKSSEELPWLIKNNTEVIWIFKNALDESTDESAQEMLIEKLLKNSRVLNKATDEISLLKFDGSFRWNFVQQQQSFKKVLFFGVKPSEMGIHYQMDTYQIRIAGEYSFLWVEAPDVLTTLPSDRKSLLVKLLQTFHA